jgi:mono/diheme cytochrome c family protein
VKPLQHSSFPSIVLIVIVVLGVGWGAQALRPAPAQAIPMFAKRTGASCELCHSVFPGMTNYGMMVMMGDFAALPYHSAENPGLTSFVFEEEYSSAPDGNPAPPKLHTQNLGILNGGFIGPHFTYYLEQHVVDGGFIGGTDQFWLSYNNLFGGTGNLQVGKFHTPFPFMPAHRITLAPYSTTSSTIGSNGFNEDDSHWGVTLSRMQGALMYSLSALGGNDLIGQPGAFQLAGNHDHSLDFSMMTMSENPLNFGVGLIRGYSPPALDGAPFNRFNRSAVYFQYIPPGDQRLQFQAVGQLGSDSDPFGTGATTHTRGFFTEAQYQFSHANWGVLRWDSQTGDSAVAGVTLDLIHQFKPNTKLTLEGRKLTTGATFGMAVEWAGPWSRGNVLAQPVLGAMPGMNMAGMKMSGMKMGKGMLSPLDAQLARGDASNGQALFQTHNCASCHGVGGAGGGIGPKLVGIADRATPDELYNFVKRPVAPMPDFKLSDTDIADLLAYVVSLTPGHTIAADVAKANPGAMAMGSMPMGSMPMSAPPPVYPPDQKPFNAGDRGYFAGVEAGDAQGGGLLFGSSCAQCHGAGAQGASAPSLIALPATFVPSAIAWRIHDHAAVTPALRLTGKEIADLTAFLETLNLGRASTVSSGSTR